MGYTYVDLKVGNLVDKDMVDIGEQVLVDTGAAHSVLPETLLADLGIKPRRMAQIRIGDGGEVEWGLGIANIAINGEEPFPCPVYFSPVEQYLIGATTLEAFGLMVDSQAETLVARKHVRYNWTQGGKNGA